MRDDTVLADHESSALSIVTASSDEVRARVRELLVRPDVTYLLSAGTGRFRRPLWTGRPVSPPWPENPAALRILGCAEERQAAIEREIARLTRPGADAASPGMLVTEVIGRPAEDDVRFWQACRTRLTAGRADRPWLVVLRHEPQAATRPGLPRGRQSDEILLTLLLAGGHARRQDLEHWAALRGWDWDRVEEVTSARAGEPGVVHTYAGSREWSLAGATYAAANRGLVSELAGMVVADQPSPLVATAAHAPVVPGAWKRLGFAETAHSPGTITWFGRSVFLAARKSRWTTATRDDAAAIYLAALTVGPRRVSAAAARAMLDLAERYGVEAEVQSRLGYHLGQLLARDKTPGSAEASMHCFGRTRHHLSVDAAADLEARGSQAAAARNGIALALYRSGDHGGAVAAELAALRELSAPGVQEKGHLFDQQVLLLTNLATVSLRSGQSPDDALFRYRRAWRIAAGSDSLPALAYVGPALARALIDSGEHTEAEEVAVLLARRYDAEAAPSRTVERAVVSCCLALADAKLAGEAVGEAAWWYAGAVARMQRAAPAVITGIMRNLDSRSEQPPAAIMTVLADELAAHTAMAADLRALLALLEGQGHDD